MLQIWSQSMNAIKTDRATHRASANKRAGSNRPAQALLAAIVAVSTLFAPVAVMAQEPVPGSTIPENGAAGETSSDASVDGITVDTVGAIPAGPAAVSGGVIDVAEALDVETSALTQVAAYESDEYDLETYVLYGSDEAATQGPLTEEGASIRMMLPTVQIDHNPHAMPLLGFGAGSRNVSTFADIRALNAGWYVDWRVQVNPPRPSMLYVQMIRVHQKLDETKVYNPNTGQKCANGLTADRTICPYANPPAYEYSPTASVIQQAAKKNPGSLWLIGNEMERPDWYLGRQDEILPEIYAYAFRDMRNLVKAADPTAKIGVGGVIQFTPLRQQWLNRVWTQYKLITGVNIDNHIDVFNIHNFIGSERCDLKPNPAINNRMERFCTGMGIPAGVTGTKVGNTWLGSYIGQDNRHLDQATANEQITNFRAWMKSKSAGNVNKPLIISEYGALYPMLCAATDTGCINFYKTDPRAQPWGWVDMANPKVVQNYMIASFNAYNSQLSDCALSGAANGCMLVQRWAWFGLEDIGWDFNLNGALMDVATGRLTETGRIFAQWGKDH
jgi:hypothetical protein